MQWLTNNLCSMPPLGRDAVNVLGMFAAAGLLVLAMKWHHSVAHVGRSRVKAPILSFSRGVTGNRDRSRR